MNSKMTLQESYDCFNHWLEKHPGILHHVANAFASPQDRDDLMQELLLAVWKAVPFYRGQSKPSTFLYRVSHNAALVWHRSQRSHARRMQRAQADAMAAPHPSRDPPTDERLQQLYAAIRELPEVDRSLILLSLDGLSYQEMADILGLSSSNIGVRLNRIKQRLSQRLNKGEPL